MPLSWKILFNAIQPDQLAVLLSNDHHVSKVMWPLSLLALRSLLSKLTIPRMISSQHNEPNEPKLSAIYANQKIRNIVAKKNIKLKKRHEIEQMSKITAKVARDNDVEYIIDFGSGLGHLSRALAYGYGLKVCCLEQQTALSEQAV